MYQGRQDVFMDQDSVPFDPASRPRLSKLRSELRADRATDSGIRKLRRREREVTRGKWRTWTKDTETSSVRVIVAKSAWTEYSDLEPVAEEEVSALIYQLSMGALRKDTRVVQPFQARFRQRQDNAAIVFDLNLNRQLVTVLSIGERPRKNFTRQPSWLAAKLNSWFRPTDAAR